jgi:hypothetical protein
MARTVQRKRHALPDATVSLLRPLLRYSASRDAYVLRGVGNKAGPVVQRRSAAGPFPRATRRQRLAREAAGEAFTPTPRR